MLWSGFNSGIPNFPKQTEPIELLFYPLCMPLKQLCLVSHFLLHFFVSKQTFFFCSAAQDGISMSWPHMVWNPKALLSIYLWIPEMNNNKAATSHIQHISAHTLKLNIIDENNGRFCCMRYKQCTMGSNIFESHICTPTINFLRYIILSRILKDFWVCHVTCQLKISSINLLLSDQLKKANFWIKLCEFLSYWSHDKFSILQGF